MKECKAAKRITVIRKILRAAKTVRVGKRSTKMKRIALYGALATAAFAAFADSSLTWTTDQTGGLVLDGNVTITVPSGTSTAASIPTTPGARR